MNICVLIFFFRVKKTPVTNALYVTQKIHFTTFPCCQVLFESIVIGPKKLSMKRNMFDRYRPRHKIEREF